MSIHLVAVGSILLSVLAQFVLKAGMSGAGVQAALSRPLGYETAAAVLLDPKVILGFLLYGLGAVLWLTVLARWDVSKAYPMVGLGFAVAAVAGWAMGEQVGPARALGVALICGGVWIVGRS